MGKLERHQLWTSRRQTTCRQCGKIIRDEVAIIDDTSPWLAFHEACLRDVVYERIVAVYDRVVLLHELTSAGRTSKIASLRHQIDLELLTLRTELQSVTDLFEGRRKEIPSALRPGIRKGS
jgi:hypothetical protein